MSLVVGLLTVFWLCDVCCLLVFTVLIKFVTVAVIV